jgi:hypothetical protein
VDWQLLISPDFHLWLQRWAHRYPTLPAELAERFQTELAADPDTHLHAIAPLATPQVYYVNLVIGGQPLFISVYVVRLDDTRELRVERGRLGTREDNPPAAEE